MSENQGSRRFSLKALRENSDPRLLTILLIVFVQIVGASMVLPIFPLYAKRAFALEDNVITLLVSSFFAAQFIAGPFIGRLSDRYGRVPVLIVSQIGTVISFVMLGAAQSAAVLLFSRLLDGITGGNIIVAQAYMTDIAPHGKRTEYLGLLFAAFGLGFAVGPALGGVLSGLFGPRVPFFIAALAASVVTVLTWRILDETLTPEQREKNIEKSKAGGLSLRMVLTNTPLLLILFVTFVGQFGLGLLQATFALYGDAVLFAGQSDQSTDIGIGLLLACVGFGQLFTQLFLLRRMLKRFGDARLVIIGSLLRGASMYIFAIITNALFGTAAMVLFAVGSGLMMPALQSLSTTTVGDEVRGGVLGLYQSAISLSTIVSTAIGGTLFEITPATPYFVGGTLFMVSILPGLLVLRLVNNGDLKQEAVPAGAD